MNKNTLFKFSMFISSYFPLYIFIVVAQFKSFRNMMAISKYGVKIIDIKSFVFFLGLLFIILYALGTVICLLGTKAAGHSCVVKNIEPTRDTTVSYIATYVVPMTGLVNSGMSYSILLANIGLFLLIAMLYTKLNLVYLNPLLVLLGYVPYFSGGQVIITNIEYRKLRDYKMRKWNGTHISSRILLIRK